MTDARCKWVYEGDGQAMLIPGCWARSNPCPSLPPRRTDR